MENDSSVHENVEGDWLAMIILRFFELLGTSLDREDTTNEFASIVLGHEERLESAVKKGDQEGLGIVCEKLYHAWLQLGGKGPNHFLCFLSNASHALLFSWQSRSDPRRWLRVQVDSPADSHKPLAGQYWAGHHGVL